eukprot:364524-Chlamydomonas_euryale.AAC.5
MRAFLQRISGTKERKESHTRKSPSIMRVRQPPYFIGTDARRTGEACHDEFGPCGPWPCGTCHSGPRSTHSSTHAEGGASSWCPPIYAQFSIACSR